MELMLEFHSGGWEICGYFCDSTQTLETNEMSGYFCNSNQTRDLTNLGQGSISLAGTPNFRCLCSDES